MGWNSYQLIPYLVCNVEALIPLALPSGLQGQGGSVSHNIVQYTLYTLATTCSNGLEIIIKICYIMIKHDVTILLILMDKLSNIIIIIMTWQCLSIIMLKMDHGYSHDRLHTCTYYKLAICKQLIDQSDTRLLCIWITLSFPSIVI